MSNNNLFFSDRNSFLLYQFKQTIDKIKSYKKDLEQMPDNLLKFQTVRLRQQLEQGIDSKQILPEAFATVAEVTKRQLGIYHYDVQFMGAIALYEGKIAEMQTGEGKTIVSACPAYLFTLMGRSVHIITVNDYLVQRDAQLMSKVYNFLEVSCGYITSNMPWDKKKDMYKQEVIYLTASTSGFDYLRDNTCLTPDRVVQNYGLDHAIVDEADSILIDEANVPLVLSSAKQNSDSDNLYEIFDEIASRMKLDVHFSQDDKTKQAYLNREGCILLENELKQKNIIQNLEDLYTPEHSKYLHFASSAIRARYLYKRDVDYIVREGKVLIVSPKTGRIQIGKRWSLGLHQALEAKEKLKVLPETDKSASVTVQNFFLLYKHLSGMTGTAKTEESELEEVYNLEVVSIPTNSPCIRNDHPDIVCKSLDDKYRLIIEDIVQKRSSTMQPILVGTTDISQTEKLSFLLVKMKVPHSVLNAKNLEQEADIVAQAGVLGAVTISTNMAGRGTDIILGGNYKLICDKLKNPSEKQIQAVKDNWNKQNQQVKQAGGLYVIGFERYVSRRVDNQLRGRSGRQGDPGESRFYVSLEDDLIRMFAPEEVLKSVSDRIKAGKKYTSPIYDEIIRQAQKKVEEDNFEMRKRAMSSESLLDEQKKVFYSIRKNLLFSSGDSYQSLFNDYLNSFEEYLEFNQDLKHKIENKIKSKLKSEDFKQSISEYIISRRNTISKAIGILKYEKFEKVVLLREMQILWQAHIQKMEVLRRSLGFITYGQKNPETQFRIDAYEEFDKFINSLKGRIMSVIAYVL